MTLRLVPAGPQHADEMSRICYEAFAGIQRRHGFEPDFPNTQATDQMFRLLLERQYFYGVTALLDERPVGSNFLLTVGEVAGVGPITVDPGAQGHGVGRALMRGLLDYARERGIARVRLVQDAHNMTSLSLYASLGFDQKEALALMQAPAAAPTAAAGGACVRTMTAADLSAADALCRRVYHISRRDETAMILEHGFSAFVAERDGRFVGYLIPGILGHGVTETENDALALIAEVGRSVPPPLARFFCPLRDGGLYRRLLQAGCRALRTMNLMTIGDYDAPRGTWLPSVLF